MLLLFYYFMQINQEKAGSLLPTHNELVLQSPTGRDVTTSLIVAKVFGKEHSKVIRDIESLSCSKSFNAANFGVITYTDARSREQRAYEMTKDGFSFLVMGYTGEKAGQFKELFISEFNKREVMLRSDDYILARSQEILQKRLLAAEQRVQILESENEAQQEELKAIAPLADYTREVLQSTSTFTATQIAKDLGMSAVTLNAKLRRLGVQFYQSGQWFLTAKYQGRGYTDMRIAKYVDSRTDEVKTSQSLVWTERGRLFINTLNKEGKL